MRLVVLAPNFPLPPNHGGKTRVLNLLKGLSGRHRVDLVCVNAQAVPAADLAELRMVCDSIFVGQERPRSRLIDKLRLAASPIPEIVGTCAVRPVLEHLTQLYARQQVDATLVEQLHMAGYLPLLRKISRAPIALDEHNVESDLWAQFARWQRRPRTRLRQHLEAIKLARYERRAVAAVDHCLAVSARDRRRLQALSPGSTVSVVPSGVDCSFFLPGPAFEQREQALVFVGSGSQPNVDGVLHFLSDVFPRLLERVPALTLRIVGSSHPPELRELPRRHPSVEVWTDVEDIRSHVARSAVFVAPLRMGGGIKSKTLEALAQGIPVVSTSWGCQGIDVTDGRDILIADDPEGMTNAIQALLGDRDLWTRIATGARQLAEERYSWSHICDQVDRILTSVVATPRPQARSS
jgi:glycosyltransferase involved in cell wall biosynthesis